MTDVNIDLLAISTFSLFCAGTDVSFNGSNKRIPVFGRFFLNKFIISLILPKLLTTLILLIFV